MNILFRVLLTIYGFCLAVASLIVAWVAVRPQVFNSIARYMGYNILRNNGPRVMMFLIAVIFLALSITFLLSGIKSSKDKKCVSRYTNIGEIKISLNSVESMALAASRRLNGVKETKAFVSKSNDGISIAIKAVVLGDINIPALSEDIQVKVKSAVEESTGIKVNDVKVLVENIYTGYKARVE
ncbi:putative alkaline shock family protein YloU [Anaerobacterium chartisolvens]|uniref:Putative alkaline shock family protein YloU n=1 Tax=Anaerobacterium chartisolvens TaxID=1297424 RepID=A0A369B881_9FIRM|nr:alkaline shock response membrane anchor protein AmaP [Anaerobacterium chartisolvens]RCX16798.1 putative alkaline shock family protein YloU [Anaerobacterium chartisolvens]